MLLELQQIEHKPTEMAGCDMGAWLASLPQEQLAESDRLEAEIKRNLGGLGYEL